MDETTVVTGGVPGAGTGPAGDTEFPPVGRECERALLDGLLDALTERGGALLLSGDPGTGKSMLLGYTAGRCRTTVLRARGVESEAVLPYTVLADLLLPLRPYFTELPRGRDGRWRAVWRWRTWRGPIPMRCAPVRSVC
ncbi:hypothetical protein SAV31267_095040 [Streptomyces avermitilis]|uniref:Orc1-like AAA ATPase domain-containing protein n=1 Tax=Streptomyces avermitilis TaxID=33903 RepID=A0A4D4N948_STRAX|nr:hypothetical protein SAV31267_095040 [Streptomyces avermitilis]